MRARIASRARATAATTALLVLAAACGSSKPVVKPADDLYQSARDHEQNEYYDSAIEDYKTLLDNYPLDERAEEVELSIAQDHYKNEAYPEAIAAFSDFQRMHPTSARLPEVEYTIGQAYMDQMSTIDRDLAAATNASQRFESVIVRYPRSEYADKAREKLKATREHLASRELYIASFYYRQGKARAARGRITEVLARYPETEASSEALQRVADDARSADDAELARLAEAALQERTATGGTDASAAPGAAGSGAAARAATAPRPSPATAAVVAALRDRQGRPDVAAAAAAAHEEPATATP
ncbi:MAG TPA: outer membrane protein assembly factor BamD [Candidatus Binatia bacterium]|nr:outer membrane protein assembly factor BamD [Candidatus Binatia bacterium]